MTRRASRILPALALAAALPLTLSGCFAGFEATTTVQNSQNSGNGTQTQVGAMKIENATLVRDEAGGGTLLVTVVNVGESDDVLEGVEIGGQPAAITDGVTQVGPVDVPRQQSVPFAFGADAQGQQRWINAALVEAPSSGYVPVRMLFRDAGLAEFTVLTVPPVGYYEGITPTP